MQEPVPGIQAVPDESNARYFKVVVAGPKDVSKILSLKKGIIKRRLLETLFY